MFFSLYIEAINKFGLCFIALIYLFQVKYTFFMFFAVILSRFEADNFLLCSYILSLLKLSYFFN